MDSSDELLQQISPLSDASDFSVSTSLSLTSSSNSSSSSWTAVTSDSIGTDGHSMKMRKRVKRDVATHFQVPLMNFGNSCYINSTIQCLLKCYPFLGALVGMESPENISDEKLKLFGYFGYLAFQAWEYKATLAASQKCSAKEMIKPCLRGLRQSIYDLLPGFDDADQHDCCEFLDAFLNFIHDNVNRGAKLSLEEQKKQSIEEAKIENENERADVAWNNFLQCNQSPVSTYFQGQFRSELRCLNRCGYTSISFDPFLVLNLPVTKLETSKEEIEKENLTEEETRFLEEWIEKMRKEITERYKQLSNERQKHFRIHRIFIENYGFRSIDVEAESANMSDYNLVARVADHSFMLRDEAMAKRVAESPMLYSEIEHLIVIDEKQKFAPRFSQEVYESYSSFVDVLIDLRDQDYSCISGSNTHCAELESWQWKDEEVVRAKRYVPMLIRIPCDKRCEVSGFCIAEGGIQALNHLGFRVDLDQVEFVATRRAYHNIMNKELTIPRLKKCLKCGVCSKTNQFVFCDDCSVDEMSMEAKYHVDDYAFSVFLCSSPALKRRAYFSFEKPSTYCFSYESQHNSGLHKALDVLKSRHLAASTLLRQTEDHPKGHVSLKQCFADFELPETVEGVHCPKCQKKCTMEKRLTIWRMPQTLIIQFKRFSYDPRLGSKKNFTPIFIPEKVNFSEFVHGPKQEGKDFMFSFSSGVRHLGKTMLSGHYTAVVKSSEEVYFRRFPYLENEFVQHITSLEREKSRIESKWYLCDDTHIREIDREFSADQQQMYIAFFSAE